MHFSTWPLFRFRLPFGLNPPSPPPLPHPTFLTHTHIPKICTNHQHPYIIGWLKTFQGYYESEVSFILPSVVEALSRDPSLRFNWAETGFLRRWWANATQEQRSNFTTLVNEDRLVFVGGGWVQNDESVTAAEAMVQQVALGHTWLRDMFNHTPTIAWQIDPFGHSNTHAWVAAQAGYEAIVLDRVGFDVKVHMGTHHGLEFVWEGNNVVGRSSRIFTHVLDVPLELYASPLGFDFESDPHINPPTTPENLQKKADALMAQLLARSALFRRPHVLIPFGMDFRYQHAAWEFGNMTPVVDFINRNHAKLFHIQYATLNEYIDAIYADQGDGFPLLEQNTDFHPYSWAPQELTGWWSGERRMAGLEWNVTYFYCYFYRYVACPQILLILSMSLFLLPSHSHLYHLYFPRILFFASMP